MHHHEIAMAEFQAQAPRARRFLFSFQDSCTMLSKELVLGDIVLSHVPALVKVIDTHAVRPVFRTHYDLSKRIIAVGLDFGMRVRLLDAEHQLSRCSERPSGYQVVEFLLPVIVILHWINEQPQ